MTGGFLLETTELGVRMFDETYEARVVDAREKFAYQRAEVSVEEIMSDVEARLVYEQSSPASPIGLNPIGSALNYLAHKEEYGSEDERTCEALEYLQNDARTGLFEALIARGHVSETKAYWSEEAGGFVATGQSLFSVLEAAFDERLIVEEHERRQAELHEEAFITHAFVDGLFEDNIMLTISPFPDEMDEKWASDLGYKLDNRKYMIRWVEISTDGERTTEQLSMSASNTETLNKFMRTQGYIDEETQLNSTEILAKPMLMKKGEFSSIAQVGKKIDQLSEGEVFLGGAPNGDNYDNIERLSHQRENRAKNSIEHFTYQVVEVAKQHLEGELTLQQTMQSYKDKLKNLIRSVAEVEPEMAKESIGEESAVKFRQALHLELMGDLQGASELRRSATRAMKDSYVCGMRISIENEETGSSAQTKSCPEIKNGQSVRCPSCKKQVRAQVEGGKIYCTNFDDPCKLAKIGSWHRTKQPKKTNKIFYLSFLKAPEKTTKTDKLAA